MKGQAIYDRFQRLVEILELSKAGLAAELNVKPQTVGDYCSGKSYPSAKVLIALTEKYDININWLLTGKGETRIRNVNDDLTPIADSLRDILYGELSTSPERFAEIGDITMDELEAILDRRLSPSAMTLRNWALHYRVNINFLIAQIGYPLLTRLQYEQSGPRMALRIQQGEDKYPPDCGDPTYTTEAEQLSPPPHESTAPESPHPPKAHRSPQNMEQNTEIPVIGLAQCGLSGWSTTMEMAITTTFPPLHKDMIAVMAIGDSMQPAGISPGNIVYCDPRLEPKKGKPVLVRRKNLAAENEEDATLKLWEGQDTQWLYLRGWLPKEKGKTQKEFSLQQSLVEVVDIAPVTMVIHRRV